MFKGTEPAQTRFNLAGPHLAISAELTYRPFKGIVSRDFGGLQMILMDRIGVPDVPLKDYIFSNSCFHIVFSFLSLQRVKLL